MAAPKLDEALAGLQNIFNKTCKTYGENTAVRADKMTAAYRDIPRLSTGSFVLDAALGGGIPMGRFTLLYGHESSGKSVIALKTAASAHRTCRTCRLPASDCACKGGAFPMTVAWIDAEGVYDYRWAERNGVDNKRLFVVQDRYAEQVIDVGEEAIRSGHCDLIVLDSIAALTTSKEIEASAEDDLVALLARALNRLFRKWGVAIADAKAQFGIMPTVVLINQIRLKVGVMYGNPEVLPGGEGQKFLPSVRAKFKRRPPVYAPKGKIPIRAVTDFVIEKNKTFTPYHEGQFELQIADYEGYKIGEMPEIAPVAKLAKRWGLIIKGKGGWTVYGDEAKHKTLEDINIYWQERGDKFDDIKKILMGVMTSGNAGTTEDTEAEGQE